MYRILHFIYLAFIFDWVVAPDTSPVIKNCPPNILHVIRYGQTGTPVSWMPPSSVPTAFPIATHAPSSRFNLGKTNVRYSFSFNSAILVCEFTVEVKPMDTEPPVISGCPRGVKAGIAPQRDKVAVDWMEPSAVDNTGGRVRVKVTHRPGDRFALGFTSVNYTFTDPSGNVNSCSFAVTVYLDDDIPPVISRCPSNIKMAVEDHQSYEAVSWEEPTAVDESGPVTLVRQSHRPGNGFPAGITSVLYVFVDQSQNIAKCTFQIHLDPMVAPRVDSCPESLVSVNGQLEPVQDGTGAGPVFLTSGTVSVFDPGPAATNQTYLRIDNRGNRIVCSYEIYPFTEDNIPPHDFNCDAITEMPQSVLGLGGVVLPINRNVEAIYSHHTDFVFPPGETVIAYALQDEVLNVRVCSIVIKVLPAVSKCPNDIFGEAKTNGTDLVVVWPVPEATTPVASSVSTPLPGATFTLGSSMVTHVFSGFKAGESETCTFSVNVKQENPLEVKSCPDTIVVNLTANSSSVRVRWVVPRVSHKLGRTVLVEVPNDYESGDLFTVGNTTVVYQYIDQEEPKFQANCTFEIIVEDVTNPVLSCDTSYELTVFNYFGTFDWSSIEVTDNSGQVVISATQELRYQYPLGDTSVTLTAVDPSGHQASCEFVVVVSLILPVPVLIAIAAVICLAVLALCCCCVCCCCRRCRSDDDISGSHDDSFQLDHLSKDPTKPSTKLESLPSEVGNPYSSSTGGGLLQTTSRPTAPPVQVTNGTTNPAMEYHDYLYIDGGVQPAAPSDPSPPPLPITPLPTNSLKMNQPGTLPIPSKPPTYKGAVYINKNVRSVSTLPRDGDKFDTLNKPPLPMPRTVTSSDAEDSYLTPLKVSNSAEYNYAYDHRRDHPRSTSGGSGVLGKASNPSFKSADQQGEEEYFGPEYMEPE